MTTKINTTEKAYTLPESIQYYEICNKAEGKSANTISWYSANLKIFHNYLKNRHLSELLVNINIKILREYVIYLSNQPRYKNHPCTPTKTQTVSAATVHGHVRTLRAFFNWLVVEDIIQESPAKDLKPPKVIKKVISTLSDQEIAAILNAFGTSPSEMRNRTIFLVLLDTGLRISELIHLKLDDPNLEEGYFKVIGKGEKERIVPIGTNAQRVLQRYLFKYRNKKTAAVNNRVFLSIEGQPLSTNSMKLMFARLAKSSGVTRLHAHLCRHTFATISWLMEEMFLLYSRY